VRIELLEVGVGRDRASFERKHGFDNTRQATGTFQMTNVGFNRTPSTALDPKMKVVT
jgi:hypothetical protein